MNKYDNLENMKLKLPKISDIANKVVFVRVDYNVPLKKVGNKIVVVDDERIKASLETISFLLENNATVVLASHLGRPKSSHDMHFSLQPIADYMNGSLNIPIKFVKTCIGKEVEEAIIQAKNKITTSNETTVNKAHNDNSIQPSIFLLENLRFHKEEEENDLEFSKKLASHMDVYINEAFSTTHRAHASIVGITKFLPAFAGFALEKEVNTFAKMMSNPKRPLIIVLGGAKISDKVGAIEHLANIADIVLVGGAVANSFLKADGHETFKSYIEDVPADLKKKNIDYVDVACSLIEEHRTEKMLMNGYIPMPKILHPIDVIAAYSLEEKDPEKTFIIDLTKESDFKKSEKLFYLDIGPKTIKLYQEILGHSKTIFWNGPMGVWENPIFSRGTKRIASTIAMSEAETIIGGGDTIGAINHFGLEKQFNYISAAGGAALDLLSGKMLPGIKPILEEK
ncbi:MAG: phosphoglycerate kinase [Pseudomonadales bacterium]|nr:phosphoglycerate kinase [Pseudomonadales bacterium]